MSTANAERTTVGLVLMKSDEAQATWEYVKEQCPDIRVQDRGTFLLFETEGTIRIPLDEVSDYLGRPMPMSRFLVSMTSYYGRAHVEDDAFVVTTEMSQLSPPVF
ncbi:MmoB/DmpM family protein [Mycobacterium sp. TY815]|uniref:MmoB/DmpM family protein n=1 Tax=Mycobacterium sp. TY815 TaxID=3050581 RepID=UPI000FB498A9|nr:MmoB/DmpM family protein [Mycobacterium sp. TY815]MDP7704826.1 MmoB/DmpM family protein [Mycobacterium sp. TY815]RUP06989.1 MAG: monooxygenase [Mycobacterium sp.]